MNPFLGRPSFNGTAVALGRCRVSERRLAVANVVTR